MGIRMRTAFLYASIAGILLFVLGVWAFADSYFRIARMTEVQRVASVITGDGHRLALHTHDLILHREVRQRDQWQALYAQLRETMVAHRSVLQPFEREVVTLDHYLTDLEGLLAEFLWVMADENTVSQGPVLALWSSQLNLRIAEIQTALDELEVAVRHAVATELGASGQRLFAKFALLFGLYALFGGAAWWFFFLRMQRPLSALESGIHRIRDGDHGFRPARIAVDELGSVVDALNDLLDRQQEAEHRLIEAGELFRTVTEFASDWAYWRSEDGGRFHYISPNCEAITGYTAADFEADPGLLDRIVHSDDRRRWDAHFTDDSEGHPLEEFRILNRQGETRWISHTCRPVTAAGGACLGRRGSNHDITLRKRIEVDLQRFKTTLDQTWDCVFMFEPQTLRFFYVNQGAAAQVGYSWEELERMTPLDIKPEFDEARFRAMIEPLIRGEAPYLRFETLHRPKAGDDIPVEVLLQFVAPDHEPPRFVAVVRDITERREAEAALRRLNAELEARVKARTRDLEISNAELARARDAAEAASRAKSVFLANMSHELRTPLNAILGFAQIMARDERIPSDDRRSLETINRSGRHLLSLINDVLEISRIEAGRISVQQAPLDLPDTIAAVEEMVRGRAEAKGLGLTVERCDDLPRHVLADGHHLRQVLINLLGNAVKYTDHGAVGLRFLADGDRIRFEVRDTGPGIAAEDQPRIFQAFYQTDLGIARGEGAGLGLTLSREFVRLMGGELNLESEPGRGSTFWFSLALPASEAPTAGPCESPVIGLAPDQPRVRILVAEDQADNRELITRILEPMGLDLCVVANGREAVERFQSWRPHFIWMDMRMPELDGYEATRRIRGLPGGDAVRIVALTASAFEEDREGIIAAGCDEVVSKPLDEARLFEVMGRLLGLRYRYAETAEAGPAMAKAELDLSSLPSAVRAEIRAAAEILDQDALLAIVAGLGAEHAATRDAISALIDDFRLDRLAELCRAVEEGCE